MGPSHPRATHTPTPPPPLCSCWDSAGRRCRRRSASTTRLWLPGCAPRTAAATAGAGAAQMYPLPLLWLPSVPFQLPTRPASRYHRSPRSRWPAMPLIPPVAVLSSRRGGASGGRLAGVHRSQSEGAAAATPATSKPEERPQVSAPAQPSPAQPRACRWNGHQRQHKGLHGPKQAPPLPAALPLAAARRPPQPLFPRPVRHQPR